MALGGGCLGGASEVHENARPQPLGIAVSQRGGFEDLSCHEVRQRVIAIREAEGFQGILKDSDLKPSRLPA